MSRIAGALPVLVAILAATWLIASVRPLRDTPGETSFHVQAFGALPVAYQGRVKPFDTLARNALTIISERQEWVDTDGNRRPAIEWLLDVIADAPRALESRVFRIHNPQLLSELGLERRRGYRYALGEFGQRLGRVEELAAHAGDLERGQRDAFDNKAIELYNQIILYRLLAETHRVPVLGPDGSGLEMSWRTLQQLEQFTLPHVMPPRVAADGTAEDWKPMLRSVLEGANGADPHPLLRPLAMTLAAWRNGDVTAFNRGVVTCTGDVAQDPAVNEPALRFEQAFNHAAPFYLCTVLYVIALVIGFVSWLGWADALRRTAFGLLAVTFVAHTIAIVSRIYISGYPPITNLYGTAVFIGWGCVLLGLIIESIHRIGAGNLLSATAGFLTLLIAHFLAGDGDTLQMMQAVLDTKFWLATHVIVINFGYSATFLAAGLAVAYIVRGVCTTTLDDRTEKAFGRMIYGVLCFALLLSFVGTVLGGLWADDSWGRFWGWDPKENGALMIVLWNALVLHARWGGIARTRGIAVLSIFGGIITAWSWFGVNQLGVGLHSYGFTESVAFWLIVFVLSQLAVMAVGMTPRRHWRSAASTAGAGETDD